jgi:hypothetical protein
MIFEALLGNRFALYVLLEERCICSRTLNGIEDVMLYLEQYGSRCSRIRVRAHPAIVRATI